MTDIVERLRKWHESPAFSDAEVALRAEAADEIERLLAMNGVLSDALTEAQIEVERLGALPFLRRIP